MRTFLALCGSVGTTRRIAEAMEQKAAELAPLGWKLAWVPPANLHVTLKFFGEIPNEVPDAITARLRQRLRDLAPLALRIGGQGVFPAPAEGPPRVLWLGVSTIDGGKALTTLQQSIESDMEDLGFPRSPRAFHPHITVARVLEPPPAEHLAAWQVDQAAAPTFEDKVSEVVLYESKTHRAGAEYLAWARVPFSRPEGK